MTDEYFGAHEFRAREEVVKVSSERGFELSSPVSPLGAECLQWRRALALLVCAGGAIRRAGLRCATCSRATLSPVGKIRSAAAPYHQPTHSWDSVLRRCYTDRLRDAAYRKVPDAAKFEPTAKSYWIVREPPGPAPKRSRTSLRGHGQLCAEFWTFLRVRKKFWLLPIVFVMAVFGGLIVLTQGSAVAPFIYTLF